MFPFSQYELRSIQSRVIINKGSKLQGYTKIATGEVDIKIAKLKAQINEALLTFISSDAGNAASGLFRLVGNNSKIVKSMSGDRVRFDLHGEVNDGYTSISIKVVKATVKMASEKVFFPIDGRTDITLKTAQRLRKVICSKHCRAQRLPLKAAVFTMSTENSLCTIDRLLKRVSRCGTRRRETYCKRHNERQRRTRRKRNVG